MFKKKMKIILFANQTEGILIKNWQR